MHSSCQLWVKCSLLSAQLCRTQTISNSSQHSTIYCSASRQGLCCHTVPGDIDFNEFKQLVYDGIILEGAIQEYEEAFKAVDDSGNGTIGEQRQIDKTAVGCNQQAGAA